MNYIYFIFYCKLVFISCITKLCCFKIWFMPWILEHIFAILQSLLNWENVALLSANSSFLFVCVCVCVPAVKVWDVK